MKKAVCVFLSLALAIGVLATVGCSLGGDGGGGFLAALGAGALILIVSAGAPPAAAVFAASERAQRRPGIYAASKARKYVAKIDNGSNKVLVASYTVSDDGKTLTFDQAEITPPANGQVKVEIFNAEDGVAIASEPMFKSYVVKPVDEGQKLTASTTITASDTTKAIVYEQWPSKDKNTFTTFEEKLGADAGLQTQVDTLSQKVEDQIVEQISAPAATFTWTVNNINGEAAAVAVAVPAPIVTTTTSAYPDVERPYLLWLNRMADRRSPLSATDLAALTDAIDSDFLHRGQNKTDLLAELTPSTATTTAWWYEKYTGNVILQKIDDSTFVAGYKGTSSYESYYAYSDSTWSSSYKGSYPVDSAYDAFQLTGALTQTSFTANSLACSGLSQVVKKGSDGKWRLYGNRMKAGWVNCQFSSYMYNSQPATASLYLSVSEGYGASSTRITSVTVSGGVLPGTPSLMPEGYDSRYWVYRTGSESYNYYGYVLPSGFTARPGDQYSFQVSFADGTQQTYNFKQYGSLPSPFVPPTVNVSRTSSTIGLSWTPSPLTIKQYAHVDGWYSGNLFEGELEPGQTTLNLPVVGTGPNGQSYDVATQTVSFYVSQSGSYWEWYTDFSSSSAPIGGAPLTALGNIVRTPAPVTPEFHRRRMPQARFH